MSLWLSSTAVFQKRLRSIGSALPILILFHGKGSGCWIRIASGKFKWIKVKFKLNYQEIPNRRSLEGLERLNFEQYNSDPLDEGLSVLVSKKSVQSKALDADVVIADDMLSRLQKTPNVKFAAFEYFEPVQDVRLDVPFATSETTFDYFMRMWSESWFRRSSLENRFQPNF